MPRYRAEIRLFAERQEEFLDGRRESSMDLLADVTVIDLSAAQAITQIVGHLNAIAERHAPDYPEPAPVEEVECPF